MSHEVLHSGVENRHYSWTGACYGLDSLCSFQVVISPASGSLFTHTHAHTHVTTQLLKGTLCKVLSPRSLPCEVKLPWRPWTPGSISSTLKIHWALPGSPSLSLSLGAQRPFGMSRNWVFANHVAECTQTLCPISVLSCRPSPLTTGSFFLIIQHGVI